VICNDEDTDGRARVTTDEERVARRASTALLISAIGDVEWYRHIISSIDDLTSHAVGVVE